MFKGHVIPAVAALGFAVSAAQAADIVSPQVQLCRTIPDPSQRLGCYDRAVDAARVQPVVPGGTPMAVPPAYYAPAAPIAPASPYGYAPAPAAPQAAAPVTTPQPQATAPATPAPTARTAPAAPATATPVAAAAPRAPFVPQQRQAAPQIQTRTDAEGNIIGLVTDVTWDRFGLANITFDDGQVWRQVGSTPVRYNVPVGNEVTIRTGMLGASFMIVSPQISFRVAKVN